MELLLDLKKEETHHKIARRKRLGRWFLALSAILLAVQALSTWQVRSMPPARCEQVPNQEHIAAAIGTYPVGLTALSQPRFARSYRARLKAWTGAAATPLEADPPGLRRPLPGPPASHTPSLPPAAAAVSATPSPSLPFSPPPHSPFSRAQRALTLLSPPDRVTERFFHLAGTGQPDQAITVLLGHSTIAQTTVDGRGKTEGHWQVTVPTEPLVRGENVLEVQMSGDIPPSVRDYASHFTPHVSRLTFRVTFAPWWLDAPIRLQASLGEGTACAPTVLGMAMDYYHQLDARHPAPSTVEIVEAMKRKGFISGYGADARMICDLAISYGYSHSVFYKEWSQAHLRQMLDAGHPVIANVRVNLDTAGYRQAYGHSVLVIGLSPDGKRVMFNDPAQGMVESSWAQFDRSWASFGPPYRHGAVVKP